MKNFRYETPILYREFLWGTYDDSDGNMFLPDGKVSTLYEVGGELPEKISLVISSKPTKQAVPMRIKRYYDDPFWDTFLMGEELNKRCKYFHTYSGLREFLEDKEPFKSMKRRETLLVYVTLYIHSK